MPLLQICIPDDLLTIGHGGTSAALNRSRYPDFGFVDGDPTFAAGKPDPLAAAREAFAALHVARRRAASGARQRVFLGEASIRLVYNRPKRTGEPDCDVVGYLLHRGQYGFLLAEGKGTDLMKAVSQFAAVLPRLTALAPDAKDLEAPHAAPVIGGLIVTNSLRYLQWHEGRQQWVAYLNTLEERNIADRLQPNIARADPTLQRDKVYLLDGPEDSHDMLPHWAMNQEKQPFTVWEHIRRHGARGAFQPVLIGTGALQIFYVRQ